MSAFARCQDIEKESLRLLLPYLKSISTSLVLFNDGPTAFELQMEQFGDGVLVHRYYGTTLLFDVKCEGSDRHGNLFLETYSNFATGRRGWLFTSNVHIWFYLFLDSGRTFVIDACKLKGIAKSGGLDAYPEKPQKKYDQPNETRGFCVPVDALREMGVFLRERNYKADLN